MEAIPIFTNQRHLNRKITSLLVGILGVLLLAACSSMNTSREAKDDNQYSESYIKLYEWEGLLPQNLAAVLNDGRKILEIRAPNGQKNVRFSLELLKEGQMQTIASSEMPIDANRLNYLALSFDGSGAQDHIDLSLNGHKETLEFPEYFQDTTTRKFSILGTQRALEPVTYVMYIVDSGEVVNLSRVYDGDIPVDIARLLVLKMEFR